MPFVVTDKFVERLTCGGGDGGGSEDGNVAIRGSELAGATAIESQVPVAGSGSEDSKKVYRALFNFLTFGIESENLPPGYNDDATACKRTSKEPKDKSRSKELDQNQWKDIVDFVESWHAAKSKKAKTAIMKQKGQGGKGYRFIQRYRVTTINLPDNQGEKKQLERYDTVQETHGPADVPTKIALPQLEIFDAMGSNNKAPDPIHRILSSATVHSLNPISNTTKPRIPKPDGARKPIVSGDWRDRFQADLINMTKRPANNIHGVTMRLNPNLLPVTGRPRCPTDQGSVERHNGILKPLLALIEEEGRQAGTNANWVQLQATMNSRITTRTQNLSPYGIVFGRNFHNDITCDVNTIRQCRTVVDMLNLGEVISPRFKEVALHIEDGLASSITDKNRFIFIPTETENEAPLKKSAEADLPLASLVASMTSKTHAPTNTKESKTEPDPVAWPEHISGNKKLHPRPSFSAVPISKQQEGILTAKAATSMTSQEDLLATEDSFDMEPLQLESSPITLRQREDPIETPPNQKPATSYESSEVKVLSPTKQPEAGKSCRLSIEDALSKFEGYHAGCWEKEKLKPPHERTIVPTFRTKVKTLIGTIGPCQSCPLSNVGAMVMIGEDSYWKQLADRQSCHWMEYAEVVSFCNLLHHTCHPKRVHHLVLRQTPVVKELARMTSMDDKLNRLRSLDLPSLSRDHTSSIIYTIAYQNNHFAVLVAIPKKRTLIIMDGFFGGESVWGDWLLLFVFAITGGDSIRPGLRSLKISYSDLRGSFEVTAGADLHRSDRHWYCITASDAVDQTGNTTECGFLACANVWAQIYNSKDQDGVALLETYKANAIKDVTTIRPAIVQKYKGMVSAWSAVAGPRGLHMRIRESKKKERNPNRYQKPIPSFQLPLNSPDGPIHSPTTHIVETLSLDGKPSPIVANTQKEIMVSSAGRDLRRQECQQQRTKRQKDQAEAMKKRYKASLPDIQLGTAVKVKVHSNDIHQSNGVPGIVFKWTPSGGVQIITSVGIVTKQSNKPYIIPANQYLVLPDDAVAVMPELAKLQTDVRASRGVLDRSVYPSIGLVAAHQKLYERERAAPRKCKCKKGCSKGCGCKKLEISCSSTCGCGGFCDNPFNC
ncbi:unknown protein [Seminavis robusta]|uniref:Uncharacterized protein n=1 Tax=Seminavis robusta TaxID=568900 RepID=A0A9N8HEF9_9STRA|nr:unknown protein [Seminavis robusta]